MLQLLLRQLKKGAMMIIIESVIAYKLLKKYDLITWRLWLIPLLMLV